MNLSEITPTKLNVLVYGPAGTGKTVFAATFPKPMLVLDFDLGTLSMKKKYGDNGEELLRSEEEQKGIMIVQFPPSKQDAFKELNLMLFLLQKECLYKTVVLDSWTALSTNILTQLYNDSGMTPGIAKAGVNPLQFYQTLKYRLKAVANQMRSLPCNTVILAHDQLYKDDMSGRVSVVPFCDGDSIRGEFPGWFDEYWHSEIMDKKDPKTMEVKRSYVLRTKGSDKMYCRTRLMGIEEFEVPDYETIINKQKETK